MEDDKRTRRPKRLREMTTPIEYANRVVEIRKGDPEKSKYEIKEQLRREGIILGTSSIQKIINRNWMLINTQSVHKGKIRRRRNYSIARLKASRELRNKYPGSLVQIDTKHLYILGKRFYLFVGIDCASRIGYVSVSSNGSSRSARLFLDELASFLPFEVESIQTDNGSEYLLEFHKACDERGITHYFTDPECPKQNGRVERFIQTVTYEFFNWQDDILDNLTMIQQKCKEFNFKYNHERFHQALKYKTPIEHLQDMLSNTSFCGSKVYGI